MYKYILQSVDGIQWFGIVTLVLFFTVFCVALLRVFFSRKSEVERIARLPLDE